MANFCAVHVHFLHFCRLKFFLAPQILMLVAQIGIDNFFFFAQVWSILIPILMWPTDVDECSIQPPVCDFLQCINTAGSYECDDEGWRFNQTNNTYIGKFLHVSCVLTYILMCMDLDSDPMALDSDLYSNYECTCAPTLLLIKKHSENRLSTGVK